MSYKEIFDKINNLKNLIKQNKDILGKNINIGDNIVYIEPYFAKNILNIGKVIKINKISIVVEPLLIKIGSKNRIIKNMCIIINKEI